MNKLAIPSLLLGVVMIAGAFAFMPVQEASTVHTTLSQTTTLTEQELTDGTDFTLTCPAATTCRILDVYLIDEDADGDDADVDTITLNFSQGEALALAADGDNLLINNGVQAVNNISGVTMPAGSNIVFAMGADGSDDYTLVVVIDTDGTGSPSLTS